MKQFTIFIVAIICGLPFSIHAQQNPPKTGNTQETILRLTPQTADTSKNKGVKSSKGNGDKSGMSHKVYTPEQEAAMNFFKNGIQKAKVGDLNGAIDDFTKSLEQVKDANVYIKRGTAYLMVKNYGAAIQDATECLRLQPALFKAHYVRGVGRYETEDYKGAKEDLDLYLEKDRTNPSAFNYMAALLFMNQDFNGALINYNEVVKLDPKFPDIYTNRGMMRHYTLDYKGAIEDYNEALKLTPDNPSAYNNRGAARMMVKELDSAMVDLNRAITLNDKYAQAYDNRGRLKQELGDLPGACADWKMAYANGLEVSNERILKFCK